MVFWMVSPLVFRFFLDFLELLDLCLIILSSPGTGGPLFNLAHRWLPCLNAGRNHSHSLWTRWNKVASTVRWGDFGRFSRFFLDFFLICDIHKIIYA